MNWDNLLASEFLLYPEHVEGFEGSFNNNITKMLRFERHMTEDYLVLSDHAPVYVDMNF